ncbi:MAG: hypothetical protein V4671_19420 [Armatimonadota bacterium]
MRFTSLAQTTVLYLAAFGVLSGCGGGSSTTLSNPNSNPPQVTRGQSGPLQFTLSTPKTIYAVGEDVNIEYTLTNTGSEPFDVFQCIGLGDAHALQGETHIWTDVRSGGAGCGARPLAPGETQRDSISTWDQRSNIPFGETMPSQVPPGTYRIVFTPDAGSALRPPPLVITIR